MIFEIAKKFITIFTHQIYILFQNKKGIEKRIGNKKSEALANFTF